MLTSNIRMGGGGGGGDDLGQRLRLEKWMLVPGWFVFQKLMIWKSLADGKFTAPQPLYSCGERKNITEHTIANHESDGLHPHPHPIRLLYYSSPTIY